MSRSIVFFLWVLLNLIQLITTAVIPSNEAEAVALKKVKENPGYKAVKEKKDNYSTIAYKEDAKSQAAYKKAQNSCMPGGNCFRNIEGRYHKHQFNKNTRKGILEGRKLDQLEHIAVNSVSTHLVQSHLRHTGH